MERLYGFLLRTRKSVYQFTFAYAVGIVSGILDQEEFKTVMEFLKQFNPKNNFSLLLMYGLICCSFLTGTVYLTVAYWCRRKRGSAVLAQHMEDNTEPYFDRIGYQGGYSWAADRTLIVCDNIFTGWKPESIIVEEFDSTRYSFADLRRKSASDDLSSKLDCAYHKFMKSPGARNIQSRANNLDRVMLTNVSQNYNKNDKRVYLSLKKTNWCTTQFLWNFMREHPEFKEEKIGDLYAGKGKILPNSLCLHLILLTNDNRIILSKVSSNKRNDYPSTWAATIGEQLEISDVIGRTSYTDNLIRKWTQRAMEEELGISGDNFNLLTDPDSLRVLALDVEGDIYNISVVTVVSLRCSFPEFLEYLKMTPDSEKELAGLKAISYNDVLKILSEYHENKNEYHPSTYLRLYLCYIHRYGVDTFIKKYQKQSGKIESGNV